MQLRSLGAVANEFHEAGESVVAAGLDNIGDSFWRFGIHLDQKAYALQTLWEEFDLERAWADVDSIVEAVFQELKALLEKTVGAFSRAVEDNHTPGLNNKLDFLRRLSVEMQKEVEGRAATKNPVLAMNNLLNTRDNTLEIIGKWTERNIDDFRFKIYQLARLIMLKAVERPEDSVEGGRFAYAA